MKPVNAQFNYRAFTNFHYLVFNLFTCFFNYFFNTCRMNPPISYQPLQRKPRNFPAQGVKARKYNRFRSIVNDQINASSGFDSANISSFPSNNGTLYFVAFQVENSNSIFNCLLCSSPLNGLNNNFPCFFIST